MILRGEKAQCDYNMTISERIPSPGVFPHVKKLSSISQLFSAVSPQNLQVLCYFQAAFLSLLLGTTSTLSLLPTILPKVKASRQYLGVSQPAHTHCQITSTTVG